MKQRCDPPEHVFITDDKVGEQECQLSDRARELLPYFQPIPALLTSVSWERHRDAPQHVLPSWPRLGEWRFESPLSRGSYISGHLPQTSTRDWPDRWQHCWRF